MQQKSYILLFILILQTLTVSAEEIASISNAELIIYRDDSAAIITNTSIENYDRIHSETAESTLHFKSELEAEIRLGENTVIICSQAINVLENNYTFKVELLRGNIEISVSSESSEQLIYVQVADLHISIFNGDIHIQRALWGDVLVLARRGMAIVQNNKGQVVFASEDNAVQYMLETQSVHNIPRTPQSSKQIQQSWNTAVISDLEQVLPSLGREYLRQKEEFFRLYGQLNYARLNVWITDDRIGRRVQDRAQENEIMLLKSLQELSTYLEATIFLLEQVFDQADFSAGSIVAPGISLRTFVDQFKEDRELLSTYIQDVRYILKLFAKRTE